MAYRFYDTALHQQMIANGYTHLWQGRQLTANEVPSGLTDSTNYELLPMINEPVDADTCWQIDGPEGADLCNGLNNRTFFWIKEEFDIDQHKDI